MIRLSSLLNISIICVLALMAGCKQDSSTPLEPQQTSLLTYQPKGTISGLVKNAITNMPVAGAVISVGYEGGVQSATSNVAGAFSFANVPVGSYQISSGQTVLSGTYMMTVSLKSYNAAQTDPSLKYRDYYYNNVTVKFTSLAPGDSLAVSDMVGTTHLDISYLNTTVSGQVVDQNQQPVANATVMLFDASVVPNVMLGAPTTTSASGNYSFSQVDNGLTITIRSRSSDGTLEGALTGFTLPANVLSDSLRSQVTAERIMITAADNVNPFLIGLTPENTSDVAPGGPIVYTFSEPIKQTAYTRVTPTTAPGYGTIIDDITFTYVGFKKTDAAINFSAAWNASYTQLTLTPQGIVGSAKYTVNAQAAFNSGKLTDNANRPVVNNTLITGDFETLQFTTNGASALPAKPNLVRRFVTANNTFPPLNYNGGLVGLEVKNFDPTARSYNVYRSVNGGTFDILQSNVYQLLFSDNCSGLLVVPNGASDPLAASFVSYVVRAESKDMVEGPASDPVTVSDETRPQLLATTSLASAGSTTSWTYTMRFSEPMNVASIENTANYTLAAMGAIGYTINSASYISSGGSYVALLSVTTTGTPPAGHQLIVGGGVSDLAGLSIASAPNDRKTF